MSQRVICLMVDGFEEIEAVTPVDLLRRAGAEVVCVAMGESRRVRGKCGVAVEADALFGEVDAGGFDLLLIPGGPGVAALRDDGRPARLAAEFVAAGKAVAAICAAPLVLKDAGVLEGRRFTAHFSTRDELPEVLLDEAVVADGPVVTARGAGVALEFGLELVGRMFGAERAGEIAASIMK